MERTRLGLATFLRPDIDLAGWLKLAKGLGLGWVELRAEPGMAYAGELTHHERSRLRHRLAESGLHVSLHAPIHGLELGSPNPRAASAALAEHVAAIELAADLGASPVVFHPGGIPREYAALPGAYEAAWSRLSFYLDLLLPRAERLGVRLAIENKQKKPGRDLILTPEEHLRALEGRPRLGACLDFGHLHTLNGDPKGYVLALGDRLVHVHLHDNHGEGDEHLGLGEGTLPWREVISALEEVGYQGAIILEIPDQVALERSVRLLSDEDD